RTQRAAVRLSLRAPLSASLRGAQNVAADLAVERVQLPAPRLQRPTILRLDRRVALLPQLAHLRLDRRLVDADDGAVLVRIDAERTAERRPQIVLVHLREGLDRVLMQILRDVAKLLNRLRLQVVVGVGHSSFESIYWR